MLYEFHNNGNYPSFKPSIQTNALLYNDKAGLPDKDLWGFFKNGDDNAFACIYQYYSTFLFSYGCKCAADKEMVKDCLQDFFLYLGKNRLGFADTTAIKPYLLKAFKRRIVDYIKKSNNEHKLRKASLYTPQGEETSIEAAYINKQMDANQIERLECALNKLNNKERNVVYYYYFQKLSYEEIAAKLNFTHVSSVRRVMYRSLRHLRQFCAQA